MDGPAHVFESWEFPELVENDAIEKEIADFKSARWDRVTAAARANALEELNAALTHQEIRNAIDSFKNYSAAFEDEFAVSFLQRGRNVLAEVLRICYNGMWIFEMSHH